jgi:hypothetical protein
VWEVLERDVRFGERYDKDYLTDQEWEESDRELGELKRLKSEQYEKGTARSMLILDLYNTITLEPGGLPAIIPYNRSLSREECQQFRSKVERLSEKEIAEEIVKAEKDFERRIDSRFSPPPPGAVSI